MEFSTKSIVAHSMSAIPNQWSNAASVPHNICAMYNHNAINVATGIYRIFSSLMDVLLLCTQTILSVYLYLLNELKDLVVNVIEENDLQSDSHHNLWYNVSHAATGYFQSRELLYKSCLT